jgi:hypothetical protein
VLDLRLTRRLTVPAGATHACIGEAQGDTMEACVHAWYCRTGCNLVWTSFADFGLMNWEAPMGSGLGVFYSVSRMER